MKTQSILMLWILCFVFPAVIYAQKAEEKRVKATFENYKTAILNNKGEEAAQHVDSRTLQYYADILELVKTADSLKVASLTLLDRLMVLSVRHRTPREQILSYDGRQLFIYAVQEGMVGKESVQRNAVGEVNVDDSFAKGRFISNGNETPFFFHFYKEDKKWRLDLTSLFPLSEAAFHQMVKESEMSENEFILLILSLVSNETPQSDLWQPIK